MIGDKRERRTALWWIEHESTNEFWSLRNPWVVGLLALLVVIVRWRRFSGVCPASLLM